MVKIKKIVNLTPHAVTIVGFGTIPASRTIVRAEEKAAEEFTLEINGIPVLAKRVKLGDVVIEGDPTIIEEADALIVSSLSAPAVKKAFPDKIVLAPTDFVRDEHGRIVAAKAFKIF